jgi:3-hydroxyacyl-CoA dehydrogenase
LGAGALPPSAPQERLTFCPTLEAAVLGTQFVQENAPEKETLKADLLARLDALLPPEVVIASSSSGLLMTQLQSGCRHPERMVIGHPFNPPHLMPLVEVVAGQRTAPATVARALGFYRALGKRPIHIRREVKGHLVNRLQAALWREAVHLLTEGVASAADIDTAISEGPGLRWALMGPNLLWHLAGGAGGIRHALAQFAQPIETWWQDLGEPRLDPPILDRIISEVEAEAGERSIEDLALWRDRLLVELLALKKRDGEE